MPQVSLWVAVYSNVFCIGLFIYMIDRVGKSLRPVSILTWVGDEGQEVIREVYPRPISGTEDTQDQCGAAAARASRRASWRAEAPERCLRSTWTGLVDMARRADCLIELVPQVGDFVTRGDPLFRVYRGGDAIDDRQLHDAVAIGPERTMEQDPDVRVPHHRRHRVQGALARDQRPDHRPCSRSTRSIACCERWPRGNWTRAGSATPPGS